MKEIKDTEQVKKLIKKLDISEKIVSLFWALMIFTIVFMYIYNDIFFKSYIMIGIFIIYVVGLIVANTVRSKINKKIYNIIEQSQEV